MTKPTTSSPAAASDPLAVRAKPEAPARHSVAQRTANTTAIGADRLAAGGAFAERPGRHALQTFGVAAAAWALVAWLYKVWDVTFVRPIASLDNDTNQIEMMVRTIRETGWFAAPAPHRCPWGQRTRRAPRRRDAAAVRREAPRAGREVERLRDEPVLPVRVRRSSPPSRSSCCATCARRSSTPACALAYAFLPYHFVHSQAAPVALDVLLLPLACLLLMWVAVVAYLVPRRSRARRHRLAPEPALERVGGRGGAVRGGGHHRDDRHVLHHGAARLGCASSTRSGGGSWRRLVVGAAILAALGGTLSGRQLRRPSCSGTSTDRTRSLVGAW